MLIAFLIAKELLIERAFTRLSITFIAFMVSALVGLVIIEALYQPMISLLEEIK